MSSHFEPSPWLLQRQIKRAEEKCDAAVEQARASGVKPREAFLILSASMKASPRWSWRPVGAKRSKVTGLASRDEAIKSLQAAGYTLVERPEGPSRVAAEQNSVPGG